MSSQDNKSSLTSQVMGTVIGPVASSLLTGSGTTPAPNPLVRLIHSSSYTVLIALKQDLFSTRILLSLFMATSGSLCNVYFVPMLINALIASLHLPISPRRPSHIFHLTFPRPWARYMSQRSQSLHILRMQALVSLERMEKRTIGSSTLQLLPRHPFALTLIQLVTQKAQHSSSSASSPTRSQTT